MRRGHAGGGVASRGERFERRAAAGENHLGRGDALGGPQRASSGINRKQTARGNRANSGADCEGPADTDGGRRGSYENTAQ
jgi:hypothetical protein